MADQLFMLEITVRPCSFIKDVLQGTWRNLQEGLTKGNGKKIYGFKIIGENKIIAVLNGGVESCTSLINQAYGEYLNIECTPIRSYENFAGRVLGLNESLTGPSPHKLGTDGKLFWLHFSLEYKGLQASDFLKIWAKEATTALTLRNKGEIELDLFKVVGQRDVHLFLKTSDADFLDDIVFTLPIMKEHGNQTKICTKAISHIVNVEF